MTTQPADDEPKSKLRRAWASRSGTDAKITLVAAAAVAAAGLLLEYVGLAGEGLLFPKGTKPANAPFMGFMLVVLICAGWGIRLLLKERAEHKRERGTLYYVSALASGMSDWHLSKASQKRATDDHFDMRVIRRNLVLSPSDEVHDIVEVVNEIGRDLELTMNDDSLDTAFRIAPNMLWHVGVGVGSQLYLWPNSMFEDLPDKPGRSKETVEKPQDDAASDLSDTATGAKGECVSWTPVVSDEVLDSDVIHVEHDHINNGAKDLIVVGMDLAQGLHHLDVSPLHPALRFDIQGVEATAGGASREPTRFPVMTPSNAVPMAHAATRVLLDAIHANHGSRVFWAARLPKTMSVAMGWILADRSNIRPAPVLGEKPCTDPGCLDPWSVLVPLNYDVGRRVFTPVRVRPSQPSIETICADFARLTASPAAASLTGRLINLTEHDITLYDGDEVVRVWNPSGGQAVRAEERVGVPINLVADAIDTSVQPTSYTGAINGLPEAQDDTLYVVSKIAAAAAADRRDLIFPIEKRVDGRVVGCTGFGSFALSPETEPESEDSDRPGEVG